MLLFLDDAQQFQGLAGGMLLRHFLAAALAPGHTVRVEPDGHHKVLVVVGAGLLFHHIAQLLFGVLLDDLLQAGLVVGLGVLASVMKGRMKFFATSMPPSR